MITDIIHKLVDRINLNEAEARHAMEELLTGRATDVQVAGFLTALRMKGESALELAAFARVMREYRKKSSSTSTKRLRFSGCVSAIRESARCLAARLFELLL